MSSHRSATGDTFVTTSWDDGGLDDLRIASALADRGLVGTFYWPVEAEDPRYGRADPVAAGTMLDMGMEIGSHTMTHPNLTTLQPEALRREVRESKQRLEELTGREVASFCYPAGFNNARVRSAVRDSGYLLGRTTMGFRTALAFDPFAMPVTTQVYPHGRRVHVTHSLRKRNMRGLATWLGAFHAASDLETIVARAIARVRDSGGVIHLWGHGWEIDALGLWPQLDVLLDMLVEDTSIRPVTNRELVVPRD